MLKVVKESDGEKVRVVAVILPLANTGILPRESLEVICRRSVDETNGVIILRPLKPSLSMCLHSFCRIIRVLFCASVPKMPKVYCCRGVFVKKHANENGIIGPFHAV